MSVRTGDHVLNPVRRGGSALSARTTGRRQQTPSVQVVILAAGMGTRLGRQDPKPLTRLDDGRSILHRQLEGLRTVLGADVSVTAVVGYRSKRIMKAAPELLFAYNPDFAATNTSKSLLRGLRTTRDGGVLWLNGDVVFDPAVLEVALPYLLADQSFVCVDTSTVADEELDPGGERGADLGGRRFVGDSHHLRSELFGLGDHVDAASHPKRCHSIVVGLLAHDLERLRPDRSGRSQHRYRRDRHGLWGLGLS